METETKNKIDYYVELYDEIQARTGNDEVAIVIFQEITKEKRKSGFSKPKDDGLATDKQKDCLRKMGIQFPESVTRKEASEMIQNGFNK